MQVKNFIKTTTILAGFTFLIILLLYTNLNTSVVLQKPVTYKNNFSSFVVDTAGCKIPNMDPYDPLISRFLWHTQPIHCEGTKPSMTYEDGSWLRINRTIVTLHYADLEYCEYTPIVRPDNVSDNKVYYADQKTRFTNDTEVVHDAVRVYCYSESGGVIYINLHAFIVTKIEVNKRFEENFPRHRETHSIKESLNVLMVGVDSVSRLNFIRQMPKTRTFLLETMGGIELEGYNKVADNTYVNIVPMTTGLYVEELPWNETLSQQPFDRYHFIWKEFAQAGYATLYAEDAPKIAIFNYLKSGFTSRPCDHYLRPFSLAIEAHKDLWQDEMKCFRDRLETNIVLKYLTDFMEFYQNQQYFGFSFITRLTHDNINTVGVADIPHYEFLQGLHRTDLLNNTIMLYFSDHGIRFGDVRSTYIGKLEERLPFMVIVTPKWFQNKYPQLLENLRTNSHKLTTPFDIYETLKDVLYFNNSVIGRERTGDMKRGFSLFEKIPASRTCDDASILQHWCTCQAETPISVTDYTVVTATKAIISIINKQLENFLNICSVLTLHEITQSWGTSPNEKVLRFVESKNDVIDRHVSFGDKAKTAEIYQIMFVTSPGDAKFEATVQHNRDDDSFTILGVISRINLYGDQSWCTDMEQLKKFCYCKQQQH